MNAAPNLRPLLPAVLFVACTSTPRPAVEPEPSAAPRPSQPLVLRTTAYEAAALVRLPEVMPSESPGLHNVYRLSDDVISGSEPEDPEALARIASWGVKTLLSVDGKVPDAGAAEALGMKYVHVPIRYSGIDDEELLDIAKTFRELDGPFYVHCYHGKHRGPAAAAVGRVVLDGIPRDQAIAEMRQWCGTDSKYEGLYAAIATMPMPGRGETDAWSFAFDSAHQYEGLRAGMVEIARKWDLVKAGEKRRWAADPEHPDVELLQEALQLQQMFEACSRLDDVRAYPDDFRAWLEDARSGAEQLQRALTESSMAAAAADGGARRADADADGAYARVSNACASCHAAYRD